MTTKKPIETCSVVNQHCLSPANLAPPVGVRTTCFSCGEPVCTMCSDIRTYLNYGKVRLCDNCQIEYDGDDDKVMAKIRKLAGY